MLNADGEFVFSQLPPADATHALLHIQTDTRPVSITYAMSFPHLVSPHNAVEYDREMLNADGEFVFAQLPPASATPSAAGPIHTPGHHPRYRGQSLTSLASFPTHAVEYDREMLNADGEFVFAQLPPASATPSAAGPIHTPGHHETKAPPMLESMVSAPVLDATLHPAQQGGVTFPMAAAQVGVTGVVGENASAPLSPLSYAERKRADSALSEAGAAGAVPPPTAKVRVFSVCVLPSPPLPPPCAGNFS